MDNNETPQSITREEFEAGVSFYFMQELSLYSNFDTFSLHKNHDHIIDKRGNYYCSILYYDNEGFRFIHYVFGRKNEFKIYFRQCFKSLTK